MNRGSNVWSTFVLMIMVALFVVLPFGKLAAQTVNVTTLAGGDNYYNDGIASEARFRFPSGTAVDASGNVYVADGSNHRIRKIAPSGEVTTLAGNGIQGYADGHGTAALFTNPRGVAVDALGNVYVADQNDHRVRVISPAGMVTTLAGSGIPGYADAQGTAAQFNSPNGVAVDAVGNVYVADRDNNRIRKVSPTGMVTTLAGSGVGGYADGQGSVSQFYSPQGVALDASGNIYVADYSTNRIRKVSPTGMVTTLAGSGAYGYADGQGTAAQFYSPQGVAVDASGNVYVADAGNHRIRKVSPTGMVTTLAGGSSLGYTDGIGTAAQFYSPQGVAVDASGNVYVADAGNRRIRKVSLMGMVTTLAGSSYGYADGQGVMAQFNRPQGAVVDAAGNVYVADFSNNRVRKVSPTGMVTTLAGSGAYGYVDGQGTAAQFNQILSLAVDTFGNVYVGDAGNHRIRKIDPAGMVTTVAGTGVGGYTDGEGTRAKFYLPSGVAVDAMGNVYVADSQNHRIRKISSVGIVTTLAGSGTRGYADGQGTIAQFDFPNSVTVDSSGNIYVAERNNHRIRKVSPTGMVTTLAGSGSPGYADGQGMASQFNQPYCAVVDNSGNVYVADYINHRIRKVSPVGMVTTLAGSGVGGYMDGEGTTAKFYFPAGVAVDVVGNVYVADSQNNRIRKVTIAANNAPNLFTAQAPPVTITGNTPYTYTFVANGSPAPAYSLASGTLPAGLTLSASGVLSGTPTATGTFSFAVAATNSSGTLNSTTVTITVAPVAPASFTAATPASTVSAGAAIAPYTFAATGFPAPTYSIASGSLPAGVTLNPTTGVLSGTPTVGGAYTFTVQASNSGGSVVSLPVSMTVNAAPTSFSTQTPPVSASVGASYSYAYTAGGFPVPTYSVVGTLPPGLSLNSATGLVSGTPTTAGSYTFSVQASNSFGTANSSPVVITIEQNDPLQCVEVSTIAGNGNYGYSDGSNTDAEFRRPTDIATDVAGNIYVADRENNSIRKILPGGTVITLAGSSGIQGFADGSGQSALFYYPSGVATDVSGNIYVADRLNNRIRKITSDGIVSTLAGSTQGYVDGNGTSAQFNSPIGVATDISGNVYVTDAGNHRIRRITPSGIVSTLAGNGTSGYADGTGTSAVFNFPTGIVIAATGDMYVADQFNNRIRKITSSGAVTTLAGSGVVGYADGVGIAAKFWLPTGVSIDGLGNIYVTDAGNHRIRRITPSGIVSTLAGGSQGYADGTCTTAMFNTPTGITTDAIGNVYITENNNRIRKITLVSPGIAPSIFSAQSPATSGVMGTTYASYTFVANGSPAPTYSVASGTLPTGLTLNPTTGELSGTPTVGGAYTFTVQASNSGGLVVSSPVSITVNAAPTSFSTQTPPASTSVGAAYSYAYAAGGFPAPTYSIVGTLPPGLSLNSATGLISGTPTTAGSYTFSVAATNGSGTVTSAPATVVVAPALAAPTSFSAQTPPASALTGTSYAYTFTANGYPAPTFSVASGTLPAGLTLNSTTGVLSGTPTAGGAYTFTIQASNAQGSTTSASITIAVNEAPVSFSAQAPPPSVSGGSAITPYTFQANGFPAPTYTVGSGSLPAGLTLNPTTGVLSGTPTATGTFTFTVQASNANGSVTSQSISMTVNPVAPTVFSTSTPPSAAQAGVGYAYSFQGNGFPAPTYTVASGTLPTGLTLNPITGLLSGTPSASGTFGPIVIQASNGGGFVNTTSFTITVAPLSVFAPVVTGFTPASGTIGNGVTIRGTGFTGATSVSFGGTAAYNFTVLSDSVIAATIGGGASGSVSVTTPNGTSSLAGFTYTPLTSPIVNNFSPTTARPGDTVVIRGVRFFTASTVSFGGVAVRYTVVSDSVIHAYISTSVVSGAVNVVNAAGNSTLNGFTFIPLPPAPRITSFTPNRAVQGATVVITGTNLTGATRVKFGAFDAASFTVNSATQITAVVGAGSSGAVSVQTAGGTFSLNGFTFVPPSATITAFTPTSAAIGQTVVITGTNLSSALAVEFGGRSAVFTVNSDSQITATVPSGAASGNISVTTLAGAASIAGFTFLAPPVVSSFSPTSAGVGASVVIAGSNFSGADTVRIGGVVASFVVNSASQITATVPSGAASGSVSVRTPYGTGSLAGFVFIPSPAITSFSPAVAGVGDVVTINGTNFTGASAVSFGGVPAASFTVVSATRITAAPASGGASGDISITTPNGTGARSGFSFAGVPVITAFSPTGATGGDTVTISGTGFVGVSTLTFGNTAVTSFTIVSPTEIKAVVSPRGSTGAVRLVTPGGTASLNGFTFTAPAPVITGFSPASATVEQTVTITGRNFAGDLYSTLAVSFGGRAAGRFTVVNDSTITAAVGGGATGSVSVRTPGGTANRAGFTFIPAAPVITGFSPASAPAGATITISGNNFFGASAVRFGGIAGTSLVVVNDSTVTVRVAAGGATGVVTLTTPSGTATSASAFTFIPAPVISAFAPASASVGDTVSITGTGFTGATAVRFGGTAALRFTVVSDSEIQAVVNGGSTGAITVISPNGTGTLAGFTYLPPAPRITSFTPATAAAGTSVVINGSYFTGTTAVNFGGVAAASFTVNSATRITAVVAAGSASGDITVTSPNGTGTRSGFTFLALPPAIASFSPTSAPAGGTVLIRGTDFTGVTAVRFGGVAAASFTRTGDTLISARVAASGASGDVSVVSVAGTGTLSGFVFIPAPSISSFTPTSAAQGDTVTIAGANFLGTTAVSFGGAAANIVSVNATQIVVLVGAGASGSLSLTTPGGSASKTGFTYLPPGPRITGFTPATATPGTSVVISGSSFTGASSVSFGGIAAASYTVNSATRITAVVPVGGLSGNVSVTTPLGTSSMAGFTFTPVPAPVITSFTPTTMPSGSTTTTMTINGRNFTGATAVSVGGVAVPFTIVSATRITARLTGAIGGAVSVTTPGGTATMAGFVLTSLFEMKSADNLTSANGTNNADELNVVASVSNLDAPPLTAFPNPASESVTLTGSGFAEGRLVSLTLINTLGQTVLTLTKQPIGGILQANVDVRHLPSGAYTAVLSDGVLQRAVRFVKR